jgi:hypothetical protein
VAKEASGRGVAVSEGIGVGVSPSDKGWKGVRVGVAFAGTVARNRVVGEAAGKAPVEIPKGATQPVNMKMMSVVVKKSCFIKAWPVCLWGFPQGYRRGQEQECPMEYI